MTARTSFQQLIFAFGLTFALALAAAPARAQGQPQLGDSISRGDYLKACKEYIQASERSEGKMLPSWKSLRLYPVL